MTEPATPSDPSDAPDDTSSSTTPVGPGWRGLRRPLPQPGHLIGAAGGAVAVLAPVVYGGDGAGTGSGGTRGAVLCLAAVVLALVGLHFAPGPVRSACVSVLAVAIPAFWIFVLWVENPPSSLTPGLLLIALSYAAVWAIGPGRGRAILLALALLVTWNLVIIEVADLDAGLESSYLADSIIGSEPGLIPGVVTAPIWPTGYESASSTGIVTTGFDDDEYDDRDGGISFDEDFGVGFSESSSFPDPAKIGWSSVAIGVLYLAGATLAQMRGRLGLVTPLLGVGLVAFVTGAMTIGVDTESGWLFGLIMIATGAALLWVDTRGRHLATSWIGAGAVFVGTLAILFDMVDESSSAADLFSILALVAGVILAGVGVALAEVGREVRDGDPEAPRPERPSAGPDGALSPPAPRSDAPPAPGWWLASDGNWYPPSDTPGA